MEIEHGDPRQLLAPLKERGIVNEPEPDTDSLWENEETDFEEETGRNVKVDKSRVSDDIPNSDSEICGDKVGSSLENNFLTLPVVVSGELGTRVGLGVDPKDGANDSDGWTGW